MKYLVLIIVFFLSLQTNAEEVWKPFGYEIGGKFNVNSKNILKKNYICNFHNNTDDCYKVKTTNKTFNEIDIYTDSDNIIRLIYVKYGQYKNGEYFLTSSGCSDILYDLRKIAVNKYDFEATTDGDDNELDYDREKNVATDKNRGEPFYMYKWWDGEKDNLRFEIMCFGYGYTEVASIMLQWFEIKPSIDTNL